MGIVLMQILLLLAHWFLLATWTAFWVAPSPVTVLVLRSALTVLAFSFMSAALLGFRSASPIVSYLYRIAAVWLGFLNFFFWAACLSWIAWFALQAVMPGAELTTARPWICGSLSAMAFAAGLWGLVNARWIRVRRVTVALPGLPKQWRGRTAAILSDLHLGHVNGPAFSRRIVQMVSTLRPDIVFIPGDLFDGGMADIEGLLAPFRQLQPPQGTYFSSGNHDEFGDMAAYTEAIESAGIRVLDNEAVSADGLHVLGVSFSDSTYPIRIRAMLQALRPRNGEASVLLNHVPSRLPIVEEAGIALQLSGHTHAGQIFPFTWLTRRVFGRFTHGLSSYGTLAVYTSTGAGTWGPPMRVGTRPEIVLLNFE